MLQISNPHHSGWSDDTASVGDIYQYDAAFNEPDNQPLIYSLDGHPEPLSINPATGMISGPLTSVMQGTYSITVTATDPLGASVSGTFDLVVQMNNAPTPVGVIIPPLQSPGNTFSINTEDDFDEPDGQPLIYTLSGQPPLVTIDPTSGVISGTALAVGTSTLTVTAMDPVGLSATQTFDLIISNPPAKNGEITGADE